MNFWNGKVLLGLILIALFGTTQHARADDDEDLEKICQVFKDAADQQRAELEPLHQRVLKDRAVALQKIAPIVAGVSKELMKIPLNDKAKALIAEYQTKEAVSRTRTAKMIKANALTNDQANEILKALDESYAARIRESDPQYIRNTIGMSGSWAGLLTDYFSQQKYTNLPEVRAYKDSFQQSYYEPQLKCKNGHTYAAYRFQPRAQEAEVQGPKGDTSDETFAIGPKIDISNGTVELDEPSLLDVDLGSGKHGTDGTFVSWKIENLKVYSSLPQACREYYERKAAAKPVVEGDTKQINQSQPQTENNTPKAGSGRLPE